MKSCINQYMKSRSKKTTLIINPHRRKTSFHTMINITLFFELIRIAIGTQKELTVCPNDKDWKQLFTLAQSQTLVGILYSAVLQLPIEQRPPKDLILQWYMTAERIKQYNTHLDQQVVEVCSALKGNHHPAIILKGQGIATYYPAPALRTPGDIDVWVPENMETILTVFSKDHTITDICYHHAQYHFFEDTEVELHYRPSFFYNPLYNYRLQYFFQKTSATQRANRIEFDGTSIAVSTIEFNRYYILQHIYRHLFSEGIGLRQMMDYFYVLRKGGSKHSRERTLEMFHKTGMMKFVGATMWVMQNVFGLEEENLLCPPNEKAGQFLLNEILLAGNFGKYDARIDRSHQNRLIPRVYQSVKRNLRFLFAYPQEVIFNVPFRTWHYCWRKWHGWN